MKQGPQQREREREEHSPESKGVSHLEVEEAECRWRLALEAEE